jgi:hypothetical protein
LEDEGAGCGRVVAEVVQLVVRFALLFEHLGAGDEAEVLGVLAQLGFERFCHLLLLWVIFE